MPAMKVGKIVRRPTIERSVRANAIPLSVKVGTLLENPSPIVVVMGITPPKKRLGVRIAHWESGLEFDSDVQGGFHAIALCKNKYILLSNSGFRATPIALSGIGFAINPKLQGKNNPSILGVDPIPLLLEGFEDVSLENLVIVLKSFQELLPTISHEAIESGDGLVQLLLRAAEGANLSDLLLAELRHVRVELRELLGSGLDEGHARLISLYKARLPISSMICARSW